MQSKLIKEAGIKASSFDDLVGKLKTLQSQGKKFRSNLDPEALARDIMYEKGGSGSIFLDSASGVLNSITKKRKLGDTVKQKVSGLQRKLADTDIKAGSKAHDALNKSKITKKLGDAFVYNHDIPLAKNPDGVANEIVQVAVPALSAPLEKAKKVVLPTAGAMYLNSKLMEANNKQHKGGGAVNNLSENEYRQMLKEKIASALRLDDMGKLASETASQSVDPSLLLRASGMLKTAAKVQREMKSDICKLAEENKRLQNELSHIKKEEEAKAVADMMVNKGLIRVSDVEDKVDELTQMDKSAFDMFKNAICNVRFNIGEEKNASTIDDLTFLCGSNKIEHRKTLEDSLEDAVSEFN